MALRIGMIGPGSMGQAHLDRIGTVISGGEIAGICDIAADNVKTVSEKYGVRGFASARELIESPAVDAVMIASFGPAHEADALVAIAAGKPVFCEKPLTPDAQGSVNIMAAEQQAGRRLTTVGFMRRFDDSYRQMKAILDAGEIGEALMVHCAHRNPTVPERYTWDMAISDTAIHEIDTMRWLLGEEFTTVRVDRPKKTSRRFEHLQDPLVLVLTTQSGVRVDVEVFVNCQYGYDIRCELVAEDGVVSLGDQEKVLRRGKLGAHNRIVGDHNERFSGAFVAEVQEWIDAAARGEQVGPNAWDGYAAAVVCDAGVRALTDDGAVAIEMMAKPELYA